MQRLTPQRLARFLKNSASPRGYTTAVAVKEDLPALLQLAARCFTTDVPDRRTLRYFITQAHAAFIVLRRGDEIAGYSLTEANARTKTLYVNTICVDPAYRGIGLGKFLCALQPSLQAAFGYKNLTAHVAVKNKASLKLFMTQGFAIAEKIDNYYYDDGSSSYKIHLRSDAAA